jgi:hypothetical protein
MPRVRVNHYGAKTINVGNTVDWESVLMELFIGFTAGVFAYMAYKASIALLFIPCALIFLVVVGLNLYSFLSFIARRASSKLGSKT